MGEMNRQPRIRYRHARTALLALLTGLVLTACGGGANDDLRRFVKETHANKKPKVEPLPEIKIPPKFAYDAAHLVDPFENLNLSPHGGQKTVSKKKPLPLHLLTKPKGPLEAYPLDALKMVGTLERRKQMWAVIKAPDGSMHRAKRGDYMGKNYGMITKISDDKVILIETVQNAVGDWVDREAGISIIE